MELEHAVENWATTLMQKSFEVCHLNKSREFPPLISSLQDPVLKQRVIKLAVDISSRALDNHPGFALKVLEHILMSRLPDRSEYPLYSEAIKELHGLASSELRRLAMRYADYFYVCQSSHTDHPVLSNRACCRLSMTSLSQRSKKSRQLTASMTSCKWN